MAHNEHHALRKITSLVQEMKNYYYSLGEIYCPYFKEKISFNAKGWGHLKFKSARRVRNIKDMYTRLKNIKFAPHIISLSYTLQEKQSKNILVDIETRNRKERVLKRADYYAFIAIVRDGNIEKRMKVIIREIEGGQKHFWSIIPYWKSTRNGREPIIYSGNMEED